MSGFDNIDDLLRHIASRFNGAVQTGPQQYEAICPVHDDGKPSVSIGVGEKSKSIGKHSIGVWCHACNENQNVLAAVGLTFAELFLSHYDNSNANWQPKENIAATYDYRNAAGELIYQVVRYEPKTFKQRQPAEDGKWKWNLKGIDEPLLYRLPELNAADKSLPVWLPEGEKDVDNLRQLGLVATCNSGGAGKWRDCHVGPLKGRNVIIPTDNDESGRNHVQSVAKSLSGVAASIKILPPFPGVAEHGDVSDWLSGGGTVEQLTALALATTEAGTVLYEPVKVTWTKDFIGQNRRREYIVEGVLSAGEPCVMGGRSKTLKTTLAIDLALAIGTGGKFLGQFQAVQKRVAMLSGESGDTTIEETVVRIAKHYNYDLPTAQVAWGFDLPCIGSPEGLGSLEAMLVQEKMDVLIIDPVYLSLMGDATKGLNASNLFDIGPLLKRIADMCKSRNVTLVLLHHCRKNSAGNEKYTAPELDELAMAGFGEFARQWMLTGRREAYQCDGNHKLWLTVGGSAGHGGSWAADIEEGLSSDEGGRHWSVLLTPVHDHQAMTRREREEKKADERSEREKQQRERLLDTLAVFPEGESSRKLRGLIKLNPDKFSQVAESLEAGGFIEKCKLRKGTQTINGWKLCQSPGAGQGFIEFTDAHLEAIQNGADQADQADQNSILGPVAHPCGPTQEEGADQGGYIYSPLVRSAPTGPPAAGPATEHEESLVRSDCQHSWTLSPDPHRIDWQKKSCELCGAFFGYVSPATHRGAVA